MIVFISADHPIMISKAVITARVNYGFPTRMFFQAFEAPDMVTFETAGIRLSFSVFQTSIDNL
jgi:hypothetical protein